MPSQKRRRFEKMKRKEKNGGLELAGDPMGQTAVKGIPSFCCILKLLRYHFNGMSSHSG